MQSADAEVPGRGVSPTCAQRQPADTGALADPGQNLEAVLVGGCHGLTTIPREELKDYYRGSACVGLAALLLALVAALLRAFW
ncbi:hypothetical protein C7T35_32085 [Variovorax sp. WS11]|uniref:hypothetical protein n=1 Tax=Variovorax sp. WS11 TaxID=1105204 RepID=UPI000D0D9CA5|nr:hypothetical protein [Variovorax sp. WS11]NDZ17720.1 hypothetical protein [Variovorax sp. WS11]PSL80473.1 hypothetical protein C7T35_32085 [Variovorax sp. WS11]